jgi:hypothetical protein
VARNAVKTPDLSEIRGGSVRNMGTLRYLLEKDLNNVLITFLKVPKREIFMTELFRVSDPDPYPDPYLHGSAFI